MKTKTPEQMFIETIKQAAAKLEREILSRKIRKALAKKKEEIACDGEVIYFRHSKQAK